MKTNTEEKKVKKSKERRKERERRSKGRKGRKVSFWSWLLKHLLFPFDYFLPF